MAATEVIHLLFPAQLGIKANPLSVPVETNAPPPPCRLALDYVSNRRTDGVSRSFLSGGFGLWSSDSSSKSLR